MSKETHVVKMNETLSHIALQYYGKVDYWKGLVYANKASIKKYDFTKGFVLIHPGQSIQLPDAASVKSYTDNINDQIKHYGPENVNLNDISPSTGTHKAIMHGTSSHNMYGTPSHSEKAPLKYDSLPQRVHIVKMNETLSHIALQHYHNLNYWKGLVYANKHSITEYDFTDGSVLIHPGQSIQLPDAASVKSYTDNIDHQINVVGADNVTLDF